MGGIFLSFFYNGIQRMAKHIILTTYIAAV